MKNSRIIKKRYIFTGIFLILLVICATLAIWQQENIKSVWIAIHNDEQTLAQMSQEQEQKRKDLLTTYGITQVNDSLLQEKEDGSLDIEEFLNNLPTATESKNEDNTTQTPQTHTQTIDENQQTIEQCIAALEQLQSSYLQQIGTVIASIKQEYWALPAAQRTASNKMSLVKAKVDVILGMESQCDAQVAQILSRIEQALKNQGKSITLAQEIRTQYADTKAVWKAKYLQQLNG